MELIFSGVIALIGILASFFITRYYAFKVQPDKTFMRGFKEAVRTESRSQRRNSSTESITNLKDIRDYNIDSDLPLKWVLKLIEEYEKNPLRASEFLVGCGVVRQAAQILNETFSAIEKARYKEPIPMTGSPKYYERFKEAMQSEVRNAREKIQKRLDISSG